MINMHNITKSFPGLSKPTLNGINLSIEEGEFCTLIGANGCGKSTLLKLIGKEHAANSGTIQVNGKIARVVQDVNMGTVPKMTLLENLALSSVDKPKLSFYTRYKSQILQKLKELNLGLEEYINSPLEILSGGQRQIIATLMAINSGCKILLLDEHTSALDPKMQNVLMEYTIKQVSELGITTIMVTHKLDDAIKYGDRLIMLDQGKVVLNLAGHDKQALQTQDLLELFHKCEDKVLISGEEHDD